MLRTILVLMLAGMPIFIMTFLLGLSWQEARVYTIAFIVFAAVLAAIMFILRVAGGLF